MVKIVALVEPLVPFFQTVLSRLDIAQVFAFAIVELAFEELHAQNAENYEKGAANQNDVPDLFQRRNKGLFYIFILVFKQPLKIPKTPKKPLKTP